MGSRFLWERERHFWSRAQWVVLLFVVGGIFGRVFLPDFNGVTHRTAYLGINIWMLIIVREIERGHGGGLEGGCAGIKTPGRVMLNGCN